jgi:hypothetical protein
MSIPCLLHGFTYVYWSATFHLSLAWPIVYTEGHGFDFNPEDWLSPLIVRLLQHCLQAGNLKQTTAVTFSIPYSSSLTDILALNDL